MPSRATTTTRDTFHNALYGIWPEDQARERRRSIRIELIDLLLGADKRSQALSELLILGSDIEDDAESHNRVGKLFLAAGELSRANEQFLRSLQLDKNDPVALWGAGQTAFSAGDYAKARTYLKAAVAQNGADIESATLLEVARMVDSSDPLGPRISAGERIRRLTAALNFSSAALQRCRATVLDDESAAKLDNLDTELEDGQRTRFQATSLRLEPDGFMTGMNLVYRIETMTELYCGDSSPMHRALLLIGIKHGAGEQ